MHNQDKAHQRLRGSGEEATLDPACRAARGSGGLGGGRAGM